jgi:mono/diheme cytochrome c family protein/Zn-finger nucleic acid-binding protein
MPTKVACPSCDALLKLADPLPEGKVRCPKCRASFQMPGNGKRSAAKEAGAKPRKAAPPPEEDEDLDEQPKEKPRVKKKKFKPKPKEASKAPLMVGLAAGGVLLLALAGGGIYWFLNRGSAPAASTTPAQPAQGQIALGGPLNIGRGRRGQPPPPPDAETPAQPDAGADAATDEFAAGKKVFAANCARCHQVSGTARGKGPNLSTVGRDPEHTVDWLVGFVRDPSSVRPNARMQGFGDKLEETDLRAVAEYLASLK